MIGQQAVDIPAAIAGRPHARHRSRPAWRRDPRFVAAVILTLAAYAAAEVAGHLAPASATVATLRLLALLFALIGAADALERSYRERTREARSLHADAAATRAVWEERAHEARSALSAIELAMYAAARRGGETGALPADLEDLVRSEVALLRRLLDDPARVDAVRAFPVADPVRAAAAVERLRGSNGLEVDVAGELEAVGCPLATTEILRNLIENARRHAPGARVRVDARRRGSTVVVTVEDDGPGIGSDVRERVFERGARGPGPGSGLGLYIARRLAEAQGGSLALARRKHGAAFELRLPAAEVLAGAA